MKRSAILWCGVGLIAILVAGTAFFLQSRGRDAAKTPYKFVTELGGVEVEFDSMDMIEAIADDDARKSMPDTHDEMYAFTQDPQIVLDRIYQELVVNGIWREDEMGKHGSPMLILHNDESRLMLQFMPMSPHRLAKNVSPSAKCAVAIVGPPKPVGKSGPASYVKQVRSLVGR